MFEECTTLVELNIARSKLSVSEDSIVEVNNAYNKRRKEILSKPKAFSQVTLTPICIDELTTYVGIPYAGTSPKAGTIIMNEKGFLA